jgi:hypothetical protein
MTGAARLLPLRMQIVWDVLVAAKDARDDAVIAACRRLIAAHRLGRDRGLAAEWRIARAFA